MESTLYRIVYARLAELRAERRRLIAERVRVRRGAIH